MHFRERNQFAKSLFFKTGDLRQLLSSKMESKFVYDRNTFAMQLTLSSMNSKLGSASKDKVLIIVSTLTTSFSEAQAELYS